MARSRYKYMCVKENGEVLKIASQDIQDIIDEYGEYNNPFVVILRLDLYWDNEDYLLTEWHD